MKRACRIVWFVSVLAVMGAASAHAQPANAFHEPKTPAEKALNETLLKLGDERFFENLHVREAKTVAKQRDYYSKRLSSAFMDRYEKEEKRAVEKNCGGKYIEGEWCGMDHNPVLCTQDMTYQYYYRTVEADKARARIDYSWPYERETPVAHFTLIRDKDGWKIDAVECAAK